MSGTERLLAALSDGAFHSHEELYREVGAMIHSRAADLRKRGYDIQVRRQWDKHQRRNFWWYRLAPLNDAAGTDEVLTATSPAVETATAASLSGVRSSDGSPLTESGSSALGAPVSPPGSSTTSAGTETVAAAAEPETPSLSLFDMPDRPVWA